ncbi:hypothetical protein MCUN1_003587 [Malassezia cuniculi]|uniref:Uncharacterized protein n=1 Tax=Malassezia cuniculi TaxID=948313 RepID=A0AAF0ETV6_9BASI|nr:hypothetical protein MCUN1_003587 [Malassezia cuniculi]
MMFHEKIEKSDKELKAIVAQATAEKSKSDTRLKALQAQSATAKTNMDKLASELFDERQHIISQVVAKSCETKA